MLRALAVLGLGAAPALAQYADPSAPSSDQPIQLEAFTVTTTIGHYHEETSSMATKIPTDVKELTSSLQILNSNAIADRNAVTLQDVYSYIVGVTPVSNNVNGFTFRGFSNTGTYTQNIEYDGLQGSPSSKGAVSAANVEEVEFLKGPNSVLYGQMHPGGLLNIVTKSPKQTRQTTVSASYITYDGGGSLLGDRNGFVSSIDTTGAIDAGKHWLYRLVVSAQDLEPSRKGDYEKDFYLYPSLTYQWTKETFLTVKAEDIQERRRADDGTVPLFTDGVTIGSGAGYTLPPLNLVYQEPSDYAKDKGQALAAQFHTQWGDNWTFRVQTRSTWHRDDTRELTQKAQKITYANPITNSTLVRQYSFLDNGHRYNYFDANLYGTMGPEAFKNTVIVGVNGGQEFFDNHRISFGPTVPSISLYNPVLGVTAYPADGTKAQNQQDTEDTLGEYVSDQIVIYKNLHITAGTRHDQEEDHAFDPLNPVTNPYSHQFVTAETSQAGVVYDLPKGYSLYASWSQSFVPIVSTTVDAFGNSGFSPERGKQFEGGVHFETDDHAIFTSLAAYEITRSNVAVGTGTTLPNGQAIFRIDGEQQSKGVELETEWLPVSYWQVQLGGAYCNATISQSTKFPTTVGDSLANAPKWTGNLWTRYNVPNGGLKGLGVGVGVVYNGASWGGDPTTSAYFPLPGWTRVNGALYYKWKRYDMSLNVGNILNRSYITTAVNALQLLPGDPRKFTLTVTSHF